jgi:hypothetical protein
MYRADISISIKHICPLMFIIWAGQTAIMVPVTSPFTEDGEDGEGEY